MPAAAIAAALLMTGGVERAAAQDQPGRFTQPPGYGQLWNLTEQPVSYRIRRANGPVWTPPRTIPPGEYHEFRTGDVQQTSDLLGLRRTPGYLVIEFESFGGQYRTKVTGARGAPGGGVDTVYEPFWFFVTDADGQTQVIQADSVATAKQQQLDLQAKDPLTPEAMIELERRLRANHALYRR